MKRPLLLLALVPLGLWAIFALPDLLAAAQDGPWFWRRNLIVLSGLLALWWMSAGMLLATRAPWLERRFGGLDKVYRLHRNIGIGAGLLVFAHWMMEWLPKTLAKAGWIAGPNRPRGPRGEPAMWVDLAKDVGEWAGYLLLALVVIALLRRIPYRYFRRVHQAFGLVFLAGAFHGLILLPADFWSTPLGWLSGLLAAAGCVPALLSLGQRIGRRRRHPALIERIQQHDEQVLEIVCRPLAGWPGHRAGQFLFADFGQPGEAAHPFTIASAWNARQGTLTLDIKALGDFTASLPSRLQPGQRVLLEGPYGRFDFSPEYGVDRKHCADQASPQIWIAGGIGITPFLAKLQERASQSGPQPAAELFYCTRQPADFPENLAELCQAAGVSLHRRATDRDGPLDPAAIERFLQPASSVWFCGPAAWGKRLAERLKKLGLPDKAFHREMFEFR